MLKCVMFYSCTVRLVNAVECNIKWRSLICKRHLWMLVYYRW